MNPNVTAPLTRRALKRHEDAIDQMETSGSPALAALLRDILDEMKYLRAQHVEAEALPRELAVLRRAVVALEMDGNREYDELTERLDVLTSAVENLASMVLEGEEV